MAAKAFLVFGNTGSGKSTFSARLSRDHNAHVFTNDEWMRTLFLTDMPDPPSYEWALERTLRIESQILIEGVRLLERDVNVVFDIGFFSKEQRQRVKAYLTNRGYIPQAYYLDFDKEVRWRRVNQRNTQKTESYQFTVSREIFEFCETIFEPLENDELDNTLVIK